MLGLRVSDIDSPGSLRYLKVNPCVILNVFKRGTTFTWHNRAGLSKTIGLLIGTGATLCLLIVPAGNPRQVFDE